MMKNEIYVEMLEWALPYIRNIQSQNAIRKANDESCYYEAELVHNLPKKILVQDFTESDIHFMNNQAKFYYDNCNEDISPNYRGHIERIKKLFELVPYQLKNKLIWSGPQ
ncbi:zinc ABC transporter substrate-binding protein [Gilliamella sp. Choc5-1]|jgi:hypothetical protein|uniref:zinc ABC transporter substrate-binding protein n=1 Tax=Gilliamella sp. Choc5-1 TaxID=3120238 RepID=UPI00080E615A|nr:zinc ABC transporter substrate-binding protein [Gilliamella apicola]OCG46650.1 zinc ABC transporter substrate-binding protein [Gilliamella apicola]